MGANCCIAAKEMSQPCLASAEVSAYRIRHSPSWSFRWDNRTHIEDIMENNTVFSNHSSGNIHPELKSGSITPTEGHTSGDSSLSDVFRKVKWQKSDKKIEASKLSKVDPRDQSTTNNSIPVVNSHKSIDMVTVASDMMKASKSLPLTPSLASKAEPTDPSSSMSHSIRMEPNSMSKAHQSPGHQLDRQISNGNIASLDTFSEKSSAETTPSNSMLSACRNDMFAGLSHGESSDGWSTHTPSGLVGSSRRDRWPNHNELVGPSAGRQSRSNASHPISDSHDREVCKLCSRLLKVHSSWNGHELAVVAVLFCGHVYHANCLDSITAETEKYDPPCPICTHGETCTAKLFGKLESKTKNKTSKYMADSDLDQSSKHQKKSTREPRLSTSSSMKDSFSRPFLKRHFSTGSRPPRSVSGDEPTRKKGFWSRHWRE